MPGEYEHGRKFGKQADVAFRAQKGKVKGMDAWGAGKLLGADNVFSRGISGGRCRTSTRVQAQGGNPGLLKLRVVRHK